MHTSILANSKFVKMGVFYMDELMLVLPEEMENENLNEFIKTINHLLVIAYQKGFEAGKEGRSHE